MGILLLITKLVAEYTMEAPILWAFPKWRLPQVQTRGSPMGSSQAVGPRGVGAGDVELPAPSVIPVAYFLYSNKVEFDTVWVF